jgi:hypothetical protein
LAKFKVFIAESNSPQDFYHGRLDGYGANELLKVRRIPSRYRLTFNLDMLRLAIKEAERYEGDIFHVSCHGNDKGIALSDGTDLSWDALASEFTTFSNERRILVNSSCEGGHRGIAQAFKKASSQFGYICGSTAETVTFHDSSLAWSILYNVLANEKSISKNALRNAID